MYACVRLTVCGPGVSWDVSPSPSSHGGAVWARSGLCSSGPSRGAHSGGGMGTAHCPASPSSLRRLFQASILDLHSGALSVGKHFVNLYR